jgi:5-methylcytosine-specific restriction endonuclease McrA
MVAQQSRKLPHRKGTGVRITYPPPNFRYTLTEMAPKNRHDSYLKKEAQLGMKLGTAQHRLRMMIMLHLAKKCGMDSCFRCGLKIASVLDFSIDHKEPWVNLETEKYWDLENIAFAHKHCNYSDKRPPGPRRTTLAMLAQRKIGPEGTAWCNLCQLFLPVEGFNSDRSRWNRVQDSCKECRGGYRAKKRVEKLRGIGSNGRASVSKTDIAEFESPIPRQSLEVSNGGVA